MKRVKDMIKIEHLMRGGMYSDTTRLNSIIFDDCPDGIESDDLFRATSAGAPIGVSSPEIEEELGSHPIEPMKRICAVLKEHAIALSTLKADGVGAPTRHQNAVPASTISFLAWEMLIRCDNSGILPPEPLLELVRLQLGVRSPQKSEDADELAMKMEDASRFAFNNPDASFRDIAIRYDVNVSTISRWDSEYDLRKRGQMLQKVCDQIDRQVEAMDPETRKKLKTLGVVIKAALEESEE